MADVTREFDHALRDVWGDATVERLSVDVTDVPPTTLSVLAALAYDRNVRTRAIGRSLFQYANHYTLKVAAELLHEGPEIVRKVLLHEAIHIGYGAHDARFRAVADEVGTYATENLMRGGGYVISIKREGEKRYAKVHETDSLAKARIFMETRGAGPGRYRLEY